MEYIFADKRTLKYSPRAIFNVLLIAVIRLTYGKRGLAELNRNVEKEAGRKSAVEKAEAKLKLAYK